MWRAFLGHLKKLPGGNFLRCPLIAGRFLTRLPLPDPGPVSGPDFGRCAVLFPLVGLVLGSMVWGLSELLTAAGIPDLGMAAALVLVAWVGLTGGLHLDGLADTADAWIGGLGNRNRTLEIMRDPGSGPFGVLALILVLLCKWTALSALMTAGVPASLIWIPALARAQLLILILTTPSARPEGLGAEVRAHVPPIPAWLWVVVTLAASAPFLGAQWFGLVMAAAVLFLLWRRSMMARLGGFSGDTAGALVELSETLLLVVAVFLA